MDPVIAAAVTALIVAVLAGSSGFYLRNALARERTRAALAAAEQQIRLAEDRSKELLFETKEESLQIKTTAEAELRVRRQELEKLQRRLDHREENLDKRNSVLQEQQNNIQKRETDLESGRSEVEGLKEKQRERLEEVSDMSMAQAKDVLLKRADDDIQFDLTRRLRDAETRAHEQADTVAREIVSSAIQRLASEVVSEATITSVDIPNDDMKGRLIGREGRNIRAIEAATGADLIVDDTPDAVTISCFDPIRREIARLSLERLVKDGRIHPARIEDIVDNTRNQLNETVRKAGEKAQLDANVKGLHPELTKLVGRLKYRYSFGENVLQHSVEVGIIAATMASEIGAEINVCRTAGFLHDIGKALSHEVEGPHAEIGADVVSKYGISEQIQSAIREHHDREMTSVESFLVAAADAVSAARPGARRDTVEHYIERLEALENTARGFDGVEKCFAIQAGREIRVIVKPQKVDDAAAIVLTRDVAKRIEETLSYPGQVKVVVIQESRSIEYAK